MAGIVLIALYISFCFLLFVLDIHVNEEGIVFIVDVFHHELEAIEKLCFKEVTSAMTFWLRLLATILLLMAKKPRTTQTKCNWSGGRLGRCFLSSEKSISSGVQKQVTPFLYLKAQSLGRIFDLESTVLPVVFWVKERFKKDRWWLSSINYSVI
jgi:hypothetical protein